MSKHTPGPWIVGSGGLMYQNRAWTADMRRPVAMLLSFGTQPPDIDPTAQANARLIAAAPELLEALERCVAALQEEINAMDDDDHPMSQRHSIRVALARAAIAKATQL